MTDEIRMPRKGGIKTKKWWYYDDYYTIDELSAISGIKGQTITARLRAGWTAKEAVEIDDFRGPGRWKGGQARVCNHECLNCRYPSCVSNEPLWKGEFTSTDIMKRSDLRDVYISAFDRQLHVRGAGSGSYTKVC